MAGRERRIERAAWLMLRNLEEVGAELRNARLAAGLTLREVGERIRLIGAPSTLCWCCRAVAVRSSS
jgi:hypothetical protein